MQKNFLDDIIAYKKSLLKQKKTFYASLKSKIKNDEITQYHLFKKAISVSDKINLIAEIKKASPSRGIIRENFNVLKLANVYKENGAGALSVITENKFFLGKISYVRQVSDYFNIPVLVKDFIIDEVQVYEAFYFGASAILLIVAILNDQELEHFYKTALRLGLDCLVEIHNEAELTRALKINPSIIGVNNRNLQTFEVSLKTSEALIPQIPKDIVRVAESGITTKDDVEFLKNLGANAVLIGETLLRSNDIAKKIKELFDAES